MAPAPPGDDDAGKRPVILHLSGDFPDPIEPFKTQAIRSLVDLTADRFDHHVVSINRTSPGFGGTLGALIRPGPVAVSTQDFAYGTALTYGAPGKGIRHATRLIQLGDWLCDHIAGMARPPTLIVGHKLAIEGIAVHRASAQTGIPYALSIQGDSDTKIMAARRDLAGTFRKVLHGASAVFPFAPWAWDRVTAQLGTPSAAPVMLPCPTELDQPLAPVVGGNGLLSVFHLKSYRRKNFGRMVQAVRRLEREGITAPLTVIGGGDPPERAQCEALARQTRGVTLAGPKAREEVRAAMNGASAFVLPSLRESFGLVFVEALFAGLPIIYPKGTAVDGYFGGARFAICVDARDPRAIAAAMARAIAEEADMKAALREWQQSDAMLRFQRDAIGSAFAGGLSAALRAAR